METMRSESDEAHTMTDTHKRPRDPNQLAKAIIDIATGERDDAPPNGKDPAAVQRGRLVALKGEG